MNLPGSGTITYIMKDVYHVPNLHGNLLSVSYMTRRGYRLEFVDEVAYLVDRSNSRVGRAVIGKDDLYHLVGKTESTGVLARVAKESKMSIKTWHRRLGHAMTRSIGRMFRNGMVKGLDLELDGTENSDILEEKCFPCLQGKQTREKIPKESKSDNPRVLHRVYSDVTGPMKIKGYPNYQYILTFIDAHSHFVQIRLLKLKSEVEVHLKELIERAEVETKERLNFLRTDGGGEYTSKKFEEYLKSKGIHHEMTLPHTPQQNGVSERMNRTILEMTRSMLSDTTLPQSFWSFAAMYSQHILNRLPTRAINSDKTPYELWHGRKPSVTHIRTFGCPVYVHVPEHVRSKLDARSVRGFFLGIATNQKAFVVCDATNLNKIYVSRDVKFEDVGEGNSDHVVIEVSDDSEGSQGDDASIKVAEKKEEESVGYITADEGDSVVIEERKDEVQAVNEDHQPEKLKIIIPARPRAPVQQPTTPYPIPIPPPEIRKSLRERRAPVKDDDDQFSIGSRRRSRRNNPDRTEIAQVAAATRDPLTYEEAMSRPDAIHWKKACAEELEQFVKQNLYSVVPKPHMRKVVGCKWVFKTKKDSDGQVERYKARLVAQGFSQIEGVDYDETFSPVTRHTTLRVLLALANKLNWNIHQMDAKSAFLNGDLDKEIYMKVPPGASAPEGHVWLLNKALYGLKQASREWYKKVRAELESIGFSRSEADHGVFVKVQNGKIVIIAVYVDDFLLFGDDIDGIKAAKDGLSSKFEMKDLGDAKWILQMLVERGTLDTGERFLSISQEQYVESILERHGMADCKPVKTPMESNIQLPILENPEIDVTEYQRCIGSLMYLMVCTRPDIAYAVGVLSRHVAAPGNEHMKAVKRVFRYLRGTSDFKLKFVTRSGDDKYTPELFVDADWAGDKTDRKSISGFGVRISGGMVAWGSKKQTSVSLSTVEAEFIASATGIQEVLWLESFFKTIHLPLKEPVPVFIDNQGAIDLIKNGTINDRTKHIETKYRFICDRQENKFIEVSHVPTAEQVADIFTKSLGTVKFQGFRNDLGIGI